MKKDIPWRLKYTKREDGYIFSTIRALKPMDWYGKYETAIRHESLSRLEWRIAEGYDTEEEALKGHEKYMNMTTEEIDNIEWIG